MRTSEAGLALIVRAGPDGREYLVQWSERWRMYSLVGGHVEPGESHRECCAREVGEELGLAPDEYAVGDSFGRIEYEAFSHGSAQMTRYGVELFAVELLRKPNPSPANRWLTGREIVTMVAGDGRPVSGQVRTVLGRCGIASDPPV